MNLVALDPLYVEGVLEAGLDDLHEPRGDNFSWIATDVISREQLDRKMVSAARQDELQYSKDMQVFEYAPLSKCAAATGRPPMGVRWVDTNKGGRAKPKYRVRLVAKEYRMGAWPDLSAATPPTESNGMSSPKAADNK